MIHFLVEQGAELGRVDTEQFTPLPKAAHMGNMESVKILVDLAPEQVLAVARSVYNTRWLKPDGTPANVAEQYNHAEVAAWLRNQEQNRV